MPPSQPRTDRSGSKHRESAKARRKSVLIVDDHAIVRAGLRMILETDDSIQVLAEVETPTTEGRLTAPSPDLAVVPVGRGHSLGVQAIGQIRACWPDTRVLVLLEKADDDALFASIAAGASGCLSAESCARDLAHAVHTVASGQSLLDPALTAPVIDYVRQSSLQPRADRLARLSADELRVLTLMAQGKTNREIAQALGQSLATTKERVASILAKLEVSCRSEAAVYFARRLASRDEPREI